MVLMRVGGWRWRERLLLTLRSVCLQDCLISTLFTLPIHSLCLKAFSTFDAAEDFIAKKASYTAFILRHEGQKWVIAKDRVVNPLFGPDRWEFIHGKPSGRQ